MIKQQTLRTRRLFRDNNRALVVAMDHARVFETLTGLKDSNNIIKTVIVQVPTRFLLLTVLPP